MHKSRFEQMIDHAGVDWDTYDLWGSAMGMFFDAAEVLAMSDIEGNVTPEPFARWEFRPAPAVAVADIESVAAEAEEFAEGEWADGHSYGVVALASAYVNGVITQSDLVYAGDVLSRYTNLLRNAGQDY